MLTASLIGGLVILALIVVIVILWQRGNKAGQSSPEQAGVLTLLQNQLNELTRASGELTRRLEERMNEAAKTTHETLRTQASESNKIIRDIVQELTKVGEGQKQVMNFTEQLRSLQDILKNPKQRGVLGEYYLETLLKNVLPPGSYQMQYPFADGTIVDAVVFVKDKIITVDSKFSLENYNRLVEATDPVEKERLEKAFVNDLKNRILETSKYIQPERGTMDFAFMFIPHEAIYYDLLINRIGAVKEETENLVQRAAAKYHVIIVSPTSFLAYLQTVLQGLNALKIEEQAKQIVQRVGELGKHLAAYEQFLAKLGNSLGTSVNHYNAAYKELKKVDKDVLRISGEAPGIEALVLDKPEIDE
jgi:DNA recombination protein RmuC